MSNIIYYRRRDGSQGTITDEEISKGIIIGCTTIGRGILSTLLIEVSGKVLRVEVDIFHNSLTEVS